MKIFITTLTLLIMMANSSASDFDNYLVCTGYFDDPSGLGPSGGWDNPTVVIKRLEDGSYFGTRNNGDKGSDFLEVVPFAVSSDAEVFRARFDASFPRVTVRLSDNRPGYGSGGPTIDQSDSPVLDVECSELNELTSRFDVAGHDINDENLQELMRME